MMRTGRDSPVGSAGTTGTVGARRTAPELRPTVVAGTTVAGVVGAAVAAGTGAASTVAAGGVDVAGSATTAAA